MKLAMGAELPIPADGDYLTTATPFLSWELGRTNLLQNGSFEAGSNHWNIAGLRLSRALPGYGTNGLEGIGTLRQTVKLPEVASAITLSFAQDTLSASTVKVRTADMVEPTVLSSLAYTARRFRYDLTPFKGQEAELTFSFSGDRMLIDDFRVEAFPENIRYEIYVGTVTSQDYLGCTDVPWFQMPRVNPGVYSWRVTTVSGASTNTSSTWHFRTGRSIFMEDRLNGYAFESLPKAVCKGASVDVISQAISVLGFPMANAGKILELAAGAEGRQAASVVITELDPGTTDALEFANVGSEEVNVGSWKIEVLDFASINPLAPSVVRVVLPESASLAPGEVFTLREGEDSNVWHRLSLPGVYLGDFSTRIQAEIRLLDGDGNLIDSLRVSNSGPLRAAPALSWISAPVTNYSMDKSYARKGNRDQNRAEDWEITAPSIGIPNGNLARVFGMGFGPVMEPKRFTNSTSVLQTNRIRFETAESNLVFQIIPIDSPLQGAVSSPVQVLEQTKCTVLSGPTVVKESDGRIELTLRLASPTEVESRLMLRASGPYRTWVEPETVISAGASEVNFEVSFEDDPRLQGPTTNIITAELEGYATTWHELVVEDDEKALITIDGPAFIREGESNQYTIKVVPAPARALWLWVDHETGSPFNDHFLFWEEGVTEKTFPVGIDENSLTGSGPFTLSVSHGNWLPGKWHFSYDDNETAALRIEEQNPVLEGTEVEFRVILGGVVHTNTVIGLISSHPDIAVVPETVLIPARSSSAVFRALFTDNALKSGTNLVRFDASAAGWKSSSLEVAVRDNDAAYLQVMANPGFFPVDETRWVKVSAHAIDGTLVEIAHEPQVELRTTDGKRLSLAAPGTAQKIGMEWNVPVHNRDTGEREMVIHAAANGFEAESEILRSVRVVDGIKDIAYDGLRQQFIIRAAEDRLYAMDLAAGNTRSFMPELRARCISMTDDNRFLFVLEADGRTVSKVSLAEEKVAGSWQLKHSSLEFTATAIRSVPGPEGAYAVIQWGHGLPHPVVMIYKEGVSIASHYQRQDGAFDLFFSPTGERMFLVSGGKTESFFVSPAGLKLERVYKDVAGTGYQTASEQIIYFGQAARDQITGQPVADWPEEGGLALNTIASFNPVLRRVAEVTSRGVEGAWFRIFNPLTSVSDHEQRLLLNDSALREGKLVPAGDKGWALVNEGKLYLIPGIGGFRELVDLNVTAKAESITKKRLRLTFTVTNAGSRKAANVGLNLSLPTLYVLDEQLEHGTEAIPLAKGYKLGDLSIGESRTVTLEVTRYYELGELYQAPYGRKMVTAIAFAGADQPETDLSDNRAQVEGLISFEDGPAVPRLRIVKEGHFYNIELESEPGVRYELRAVNHPLSPGARSASEWLGTVDASGTTLTFRPRTFEQMQFFWVIAYPH